MKANIHAAPKHLPPLPEGAVYLGRGPISTPESIGDDEELYATTADGFFGTWGRSWCIAPGCRGDEHGHGNDEWHYAGVLDSPVTRHILAHRVPDGVPVLPEGFVYAGRLGDYPEGKRLQGLSLAPNDGTWVDSREDHWRGVGSCGGVGLWHYACKIDSPLARKLLRLEPDTRPSWEDAPEWAEWLAQDWNGDWWWFDARPEPEHTSPGSWDTDRAKEAAPAGEGEPTNDWRSTLEPRPAQEGHGTNPEPTDEASGRISDAVSAHWRESCGDEGSVVTFELGEEPDLIIPPEVCDDLESVSVIAFTARAEGYLIEWGQHGLRGWKG